MEKEDMICKKKLSLDGMKNFLFGEKELHKPHHGLQNKRGEIHTKSQTYQFIPAGLSPASDGAVHYVIRHQEERLKLQE